MPATARSCCRPGPPSTSRLAARPDDILVALCARHRADFSTFGVQRAWRLPGTYLYRLAPTGFETRNLANGIYDVVVTAEDVAGNKGSAHQVFIVRNGAKV